MIEEIVITLDMDSSLRSSDIDLLRSFILPYPDVIRRMGLLLEGLHLLHQ